MNGAQLESVPTSAYCGAVATLATMHDKSALIGPATSGALGMTVQTSHVDIDRSGTSTDDVTRPDNASDTAAAKPRLGMPATGTQLGLASEPTFGPSPAIRDRAAVSPDGYAHIETDLRAIHCPARRPVIASAAQRLAARLALCCPTCATPGWGIDRVVGGVPYRHCERTVLIPSADVHGCSACRTELVEPPSGSTFADPGPSEWCNP